MSQLYIDTGSYYSVLETNDEYKYISVVIEKQFDTSNQDEKRRKRPLPVGIKPKIDYMNLRQEGW